MREAKDAEERTRTCAERWESREGLCLSNQWMLRTGESKSRLAKAAGRRALWRDERGKRARCCGAKQRYSRRIKKAQARHVRRGFGSSLVENLQGIVARTACARKGWKVAKVFVFPICWGSRRSKSMLAEAVGAEPFGEMRGGKRGRFCGEVELEVKSQEAKSTSCPEQFWEFIGWKTAWRCGAKHILKSKCAKHTRFGARLEVEMLEKCTALWREAHLEVKCVKNWRSRSTFGS